MDAETKKVLKWEYIGIILIVISFFIFDYFPKIVEIRQMGEIIKQAKTNKNENTQAENDREKQRIKQKLEHLQRGFSYITTQISTAKKKMSQEKNVPMVTLEIEDLASSTQIELMSIKPAANQISQDVEIVPIELGFKSDYHKLLKFLSRIDHSSVCLVVHKLNISKDDISYPQLNVQLTLNALFDTKSQAEIASTDEGQSNAE